MKKLFFLKPGSNLLSLSLSLCLYVGLFVYPLNIEKAWGSTFSTMNKPEIEVIAHRGFSSKTPENTMAAIKEAFHSGVSHIEIDVQLSKDGEVILLHDSSLDRTTNGYGKASHKTLKQLKELDAGSWFSSKFKGEKIPTLKEVLEWLPKEDLTLIIEVKSTAGTFGIESKITSLIKEAGKSDQVWLKSFDKSVLHKFQKLTPDIPKVFVFVAHTETLGITLGTSLDWGNLFEELKSINVTYLQPHSFFLTKSLSKKLRSQGFKLIAWGVNSKRRLNQMVERKVDLIETDYPLWALKNL